MLLEAANVSAGYSDVPVFRGISLNVRPGELVGLIGPNGAGKSTLLRALSGIIPLQAGTVNICGSPITRDNPLERAQKISFVPQTEPAVFDFSVRDVVMMGRYSHSKSIERQTREGRVNGVAADFDAANSALEITETISLSDRFVTNLSGGEHRRVLIARAIAQDTPLMMLDEPVAHLDIKHQVSIMKVLRSLADDSQKGCLAALHDLNLASEFCDRIYLIADGNMVSSGEPKVVLTHDNIYQAYGASVTILDHPTSGRPLIITSAQTSQMAIGTT